MLAKTGSIKSVVALVANIANDPGYGSRTNLGVDKPGSDDGDRLAFM